MPDMHFKACEFITKGLLNDPSFRFPCTCDVIYRRVADREQARLYLEANPDEAVAVPWEYGWTPPNAAQPPRS